MPNTETDVGTLMVNKTTGAITGPVSAATFAAENDLGAGAPEAHAASHASAGADPVTLAESQVTGLTAALAAKQPLATVLTNTTAAFTTAQETKLSGVATGATANSADATLLARANHTGTQSADTLTDGTTNKAFLATERTKLAGIATAATANESDANLRDRTTHTGAQAISTVTGLQAALDGKQPIATVLTNTTAAFTTAQESKLAGIEAAAQANVALASQAEAEAGTENTKTMTALRTTQAIARHVRHFYWSFNPKAVCDGTIDRLFLMTVGPDFPNGLKITRWNTSFDADPATEADLDFKRADAFIGGANAAVVDVLDTTAGVSSETTAANINADAAVANGKVLYLEFGTAYTDDNLQIIFEFWGYAV